MQIDRGKSVSQSVSLQTILSVSVVRNIVHTLISQFLSFTGPFFVFFLYLSILVDEDIG